MDDVPCLKFTSTLVCVQVLLDLTDETNKKQAWRMLQYLQTGYFSAVSEDILKRLVDHYPHKLTNELLIAIAPPQIKELKLQNCTKITPSKSYRVFQKCRNVEKVNLNHCSQMMLPDLFVLLDVQKVNITSLSLEGCPTVNSEVVQSVLRNLKKLKHLNISSCGNVHNDSFLLSPKKQSARLDIKGGLERDVYECSLVSIDISGCRNITDVGIQNLVTLTGPTLRSVNAAWTEISPLSLLCLCGCLLPGEILHANIEDEVRETAVMRLIMCVQKYLQQQNSDELKPETDTSQILVCNTTSSDELKPETDTSQILVCNTTSSDELKPETDTSQILVCNTTSSDEMPPVTDTSQILVCNTASSDEMPPVTDTSKILVCNTTSSTDYICNVHNLDDVDNSLISYDTGGQEVNVDGCQDRSKMSAPSDVTVDNDSLCFVYQEAYYSPVSSNTGTDISEICGSCMDLGVGNIEISNTYPQTKAYQKTYSSTSTNQTYSTEHSTGNSLLKCANDSMQHKSVKSYPDLPKVKICSDKSEDLTLFSCDANNLPTGIPCSKVPKDSVKSQSESRIQQLSCIDNDTESVVQSCSSSKQCGQSLDISVDTECRMCHQIITNKDTVSHTILSKNDMTSDQVPSLNKELGINLISGKSLDPPKDYSCSVMQDKSTNILEETQGPTGKSLGNVSQEIEVGDEYQICSQANVMLNNHDDSTEKCSNRDTVLWPCSQKDNSLSLSPVENDKTCGVLVSEEISSCPQHLKNRKPQDFQEATGIGSVGESVVSTDSCVQTESQSNNLSTKTLHTYDLNKSGAKFSDKSQRINKDTDMSVVISSASDSVEIGAEMLSADNQQDQVISDQILNNCNSVGTSVYDLSVDDLSVTAESSGDIIPRYQSNLMSLDISDIQLLEEDITRICLQYFIHKNSEIQKLGISWCNFKDEDLKNIAVKLKKLREITLIDCYALTSDGISFLGKTSKNLVKTDLKGVSFIGDRAIFPFLQKGNIESLGLAECNICDGTLINIAARNITVMKKLDLSWCEEISERGINSLCSKKSDLESLSVRQCPASSLTLALMSTNFRNLKYINLSSIERVSDDAIVGMAKGLKFLEEIDIGWNSGLSNESVRGLLTHCPFLRKLVLSGLKLLTSAPFLPIISDLKKWRQCQACLQLKLKEREILETEDTDNESSDEDYDFLCVPHRSTIYAANLTSLHLEYCDSINDQHMREIVAVCRGSLQVVDYYSEDVQPVLLRPKKGKFNLALNQADLD